MPSYTQASQSLGNKGNAISTSIHPYSCPADHGRKINVAELLVRAAVFRENLKWWTKIHTRLTGVFRAVKKKVIQQSYLPGAHQI